MKSVRPEKGAWTIVALLFLFMMINFADKAIIGLAGVPIMTELNLTPKQFGLGRVELLPVVLDLRRRDRFHRQPCTLEAGPVDDGTGLGAGPIPDAGHRGDRNADRLPDSSRRRRGAGLSGRAACCL